MFAGRKGLGQWSKERQEKLINPLSPSYGLAAEAITLVFFVVRHETAVS
jgi:hypothetical protein